MSDLPSTPIDLERIAAEAQKAAWLYDYINSACPYPFDSPEGRAFKAAYTAARQTMNYGPTPADKQVYGLMHEQWGDPA